MEKLKNIDLLRDFERYIELEYDILEDTNSNIVWNKPFNKLSITDNKLIFKVWNKFGFKNLFKNYILWDYNSLFTMINHTFILKKFKSKKGEVFTMKSNTKFENTTHFDEVKISKKTGRCIGFVKGNDFWFDLCDVLCPYKCIPNYCNYRYLSVDKNILNLSQDNLIPIPKGMTLKNLKDATNWFPRFNIYPNVEAKIKTLPEKKVYSFMRTQDDKVWLNHNIVCLIMDMFVIRFIRKTITRITDYSIEWFPEKKSHYFMVNAYARKFGFYPTLDRLVLTFWKFKCSFYEELFFILKDVKYEFQILDKTSIRL